MRLLIVSQYFWPESFIINDLARTLRSLGHHVVVATGKPNYPEGRIFSGYSERGTVREYYDGDIEVLRVPMRPRGKGGAVRLFRNYVSFAWSGWRRFPKMLAGRRFDAIVVFAVSPITMAIPAIALKKSTGAHLAIWVQDLWPESLTATGYVRNATALRLVASLVRRIYAAADTILVQSRAFAEPVRRLAPHKVIEYYPNSFAAPDGTSPGAELPRELTDALGRYFCCVFAGNVGKAQSVDTLVDAATRLRDLPDVRIVIVGSGSESERIRDRIRDLGLSNVLTFDRLPATAMPELFRRSAALVVTLRDEEIFARTVPSKIPAYLSAGRPIVAAVNGEGAHAVEEAGAGITCPAEDAEALAAAVRRLHAMTPDQRAEVGASGHRYFLEHFELSRCAGDLAEILERRIMEERAG